MKVIFTLLILLANALIASAQWSNTTNSFYDSLHMPVCTAGGDQRNAMSITSNPDGGTIVFWEDKRDGFVANTKIYAQKFDKLGNKLWAVNGVPVSSGTNNQHFTFSSTLYQDYRNRTVAATDNAGGFYICYTDDSLANYEWRRICVQHIKNDGSAVFAGPGYIEGQTIAGQNYNYSWPQLIGDETGGFYLSYILNNIIDELKVYSLRDVGGTMQRKGGGIVNENVVQKTEPYACQNTSHWYLIHPATIVIDYTIWPDLLGNCSVLMSLNSNDGTQGKMLGYNRVWKAKANAHVTNATVFPTGDPKTEIIDYAPGDVDILYKHKNLPLNRSCHDANNILYVWTDDISTSNGFLTIFGGDPDYNFPKGITLSTPGNINVEVLAASRRTYDNNTLSDFVVYAFGQPVEKYDSIPFQRGSFSDPLVSYNPIPANLDKLNDFRDTLLTAGTGFYNFSLAAGSNQAYAAALLNEPGQVSFGKNVYLQHLAVERQSANSFAVTFKTNSKKGVLIGKELNTGFSATNIIYDFPQLTVNNTGNAFFSIRESERYIRVSPVGTGADLLWGAMGKPIGTPIFNGSYPNPEFPFVSLDPVDGMGVISWQDVRNLPANTGSNIFMRHLDNLNTANYAPPNKKIQPLINGSSPANPFVLIGASKKYSLIEAFNSTTGTTSPVVEILDNYNLGAVSVNVYENTGTIRFNNGKPYLDRNYTIKPENNPNGTADINVRLFFTTAQFDALKLADPTIADPGSLSVIKQTNATGTVPAAFIPTGSETELKPVSWLAADGGYYVEIAVNSFSNFFIQKTSAALPVKWLGVQAQWQNTAEAKISWQVAEQLNVNGYTVQRSEDGINFTDVCNITASAVASYSCIVPAAAKAINYYRVLQRDLDNKFSYSKTVILKAAATISLAVHPNPAKDKLYIDGIAGYRSLEISAINGIIMQRQDITAGLKYIDITKLGPGLYLLTVTSNKETKTLKFIRN
jgi:Secretion system C-terminal sorting domain